METCDVRIAEQSLYSFFHFNEKDKKTFRVLVHFQTQIKSDQCKKRISATVCSKIVILGSIDNIRKILVGIEDILLN